MGNATDSKGRIAYFEPNELFGGDNQPVNQEDLTKYVNLSVSIPSRNYRLGGNNKKYDSILQGMRFEEKINGKDYTKFYLTDNYVNVSYTEFGKDGQISSGELFGIESINISFDVQFQPIVVINFVDVRGMGLMSTMEYNYSEGGINNLTAKSFFTSLFNFPYPIFTLEVKGYYGKSVSFDLALKDFHTAFDSTTGNFKTSVSFIGHLYGVYGDIPMSFVMASPYFDYSGLDKNSSTECVGETWKGLGGDNIPTYIGILSRFKDIVSGDNLYNTRNTSSASYQAAAVVAQYQKLEEEKNILLDVQECYESIIKIAEITLDNICPADEEGSYKYKDKDCKGVVLSETLAPSHKALPQGQKQNYLFKRKYNENNECVEGGFVFPYKGDNAYEDLTLDDKSYYYDYDIQKKHMIDDKFQLKIDSYENKTIEIGGKTHNLIIFLDIYDKLHAIKTEIQNIEREIRTNQTNVRDKIIDIVSNKIGFKPCIKNIYQILFKHLNCFSTQLYTTIRNVPTIRNKNSLKIMGNYITDIVGYDKGENITPFPLFARIVEKERKIIYPGDIIGFSEQPEIKMVENIYSSLNYLTDKVGESLNEIQMARQEEEDGREINLSTGNFFADLDRTIDYKEKNYFTIKKTDSDYTKASKIRNIFLERLATFKKTHFNDNIDTFIKIETELLKASNPDLDNNTLIALENLTTDVENVYNGLIGNNSIGGGIVLKNNDINSTIRIFNKGNRYTCKSTIDSFQIDNNLKIEYDKYDHYELDDEDWIDDGCISASKKITTNYNGYEKTHKQCCESDHEGKFNMRMYLTLAVSTTWDVVDPDPAPCGEGRRDSVYTYFRTKNTAYVTDENSYNLFDWMCSSYTTKTKNIKFCSDSYSSLDNKTYSTITKKQDGNKVALISLAHLLAIGEVFLSVGTGRKMVPITKLADCEALYSNLSVGAGIKYAEYFYACSSEFEKYCEGLYRHFFSYNEKDEDKEKYDYFMKDINDIKKGDIRWASEQWFVIGREILFDDVGISRKTTKYDDEWGLFLNELYPKYGYSKSIVENVEKAKNKEIEILELKTNIYYTLKTLYDKWFCGLSSDFFNMYENKNITYNYSFPQVFDGYIYKYAAQKFTKIRENSEFNKIKYLTTTFNDISESLIVDIEAFANQILSIKENPDNVNVSVLSYMAKTAQDNQSTFIVLPTNIFDQNLKDAFRTYNFYDGTAKHDEQGSTYVVMYNGDVSHILDNSNSEYAQDGFTIADYHNGKLEITEEAAEIMAHEVESGHNYTIQAFGVTCGMQNQNIFRNISVDTQTPQVTDYSIANMLTIAEEGSGLANGANMLTKVQSLYPVYANRSYNCTVEMMGCMNISPLMYFQLNNIPMFKGAYMITNVEHRITANDFVTTFTGVRVSKYNIPINRETINISRVGTIPTDGMNINSVDWVSSKPTTELVTSKTIGGLTFNTIDPNNDYWFPYSGATTGRAIGGNFYYSYDDDCMASVRKSIAMMVTGDYNADSSTKGAAYHFTDPTNVVQLLYEKDGKLYYVDRVNVNNEGDYQKYNRYIICRKYMIECLNNGHPVCVGVTHSIGGRSNHDKTTDHWLCVYAYAEDNNKTYFKFYESGSSRKETCISNGNILIFEENVTTQRPAFYCEKNYKNKRYDVSQVRINKNLNYDFINKITQPYQEPEKFEGNTEYLYQP